MTQAYAPYKLHATGEWLAVTGPDEAVAELRRSVSLTFHQGWWWLPLSQDNCTLVETVWPIAEATDGYRAARERHLGLPPELLAQWRQYISSSGLDDAQFADYQVCAIAQGYHRGRLYNASDPGTGKTRVALALAQLWGCDRSLVVVQKSIADEWVREAAKIGSSLRVEVLTGPIKERVASFKHAKRERGLILVTNYESFSPKVTGLGRKRRVVTPAVTDGALEYEPQQLIIDESWKICKPTTKWTIELIRVADATRYAVLNTGTPVGSSSLDLWPQLRAIGHCPWTEKEFTARFVNFEKFKIGRWQKERPRGGKNLKELLAEVRSVWFRVVKEGVTDLLPKREPQIVTLEMLPEHRKFYEKLAKGEISVDRDDLLDNPLVSKLRLVQLCGGVLFDHTRGELLEFDCAKLRWLLQFAEDNWLEVPHRRAIVWHRFNDEIARVTTRLREILGHHRVVAITGDEQSWGRVSDPMLGLSLSDVKDSFNSKHPDGVQVIVCQIEKMFAGHNLQACDDSICFTHTWRYIARAQLLDRSHRLGREGQVSYYDLCYRGSKDAEILETLQKHEDFALQLHVESYRVLRVGV